MRNCRFKVYINGGDVTLTLKPGQVLEWYKFYNTDEGWSSVYESWGLNDAGTELQRDCVSDGTDCDGRLTRFDVAFADADPATFTEGYDPYKAAERGQRFPYWKQDRSEQRDQYAELANY